MNKPKAKPVLMSPSALRVALRYAEEAGHKMGIEAERKATESREKEMEAHLDKTMEELAQERIASHKLNLEIESLKKSLDNAKNDRDGYYHARNSFYAQTNELKKELDACRNDCNIFSQSLIEAQHQNKELKRELLNADVKISGLQHDLHVALNQVASAKIETQSKSEIKEGDRVIALTEGNFRYLTIGAEYTVAMLSDQGSYYIKGESSDDSGWIKMSEVRKVGA